MYRPLIFTSIAGLLLIVASQFQLTRPFENGYSWLIQPVLAAEARVTRKAVNLISVVVAIGDLAKENTVLRQKNTELEAQLVSLKEVAHENTILKQELQFAKESQGTYLPAGLIGRTPTGIIKDLIVDRGSNDGVTVGQVAIAQGYLIGKVIDTAARQSTIRLITNPRSLVPILLQDSRSTGILRGGISGLTVTDILIDAPVNLNEAVVTSGLGGEFPAGLPVGKVIETIDRKGDITKKATVSSPVDITKLEMIFLKKP